MLTKMIAGQAMLSGHKPDLIETSMIINDDDGTSVDMMQRTVRAG